MTGQVLYSGDAPDLKTLPEQAVASGANLAGANLRDANLARAMLMDATLEGHDVASLRKRGARV